MLSMSSDACCLSGDTGDKCYAYVLVPHEGVLSAYDYVTVNRATKPRIGTHRCDGRRSGQAGRVTASVQGRPRRHILDYLLDTADGPVVVDVVALNA